jgi:hypothetical protein
MTTRRPRAARWAIRVLAVCTTLLALRAWHVHDETWDWRLSPAAAPTKVQFLDRDYSRGSDATAVEPGFVRRGETDGGGTIYTTPGPLTPTVLDVVDGDRVVTYELMGGP